MTRLKVKQCTERCDGPSRFSKSVKQNQETPKCSGIIGSQCPGSRDPEAEAVALSRVVESTGCRDRGRGAHLQVGDSYSEATFTVR